MPHVSTAHAALALASLGALALLAGEASAQTTTPTPRLSAPSDEGTERHDGFFLRMATGLDTSQMIVASDRFELKFNSGVGFGGVLDVAIGGAISENLILHATVLAFDMTNPQTEINGTDVPSGEPSVYVALVGAGVTYYVMPLNLYISGSVGVSEMQITFPDSDQAFEAIGEGPAFAAQVGKEWWVSANWGLGVAAVLAAGSRNGNNDAGEEVTTTFAGFGLLFSATYN